MRRQTASTHSLRGLALALFLPAACAAADDPASLAGSAWRAVNIAGEAVPEAVEARLQFGADERLTGSGGCNRFTGGYTAADGTLAIGQIAATRMACAEPQMQVEQELFAAFEDVRSFASDGTELELRGEDGIILVTLVRADPD